MGTKNLWALLLFPRLPCRPTRKREDIGKLNKNKFQKKPKEMKKFQSHILAAAGGSSGRLIRQHIRYSVDS
jgi:hypothetical protein